MSTDTDAPEAPVTEPEPSTDEPLGEPGKKALVVEREARKQAEKATADLQARIDTINTAQLSDLEKAQATATAAQEEAATATREALRYKLAARFGVNAEPGEDGALSDAEMFLTGTTEAEIVSQAERLAALNKARQDAALIDPTQGGGGRPAPVEQAPGVSRLAAAFDAQLNP